MGRRHGAGIGQTALGRRHGAMGIGPHLLQRRSHARRRRIEHRCDLTHVRVSLLEKIALEYMGQGRGWGEGPGEARAALGFGCGSDTRISSAKLLSSPSRALMASKSNTNCARQQAQCYWGRCSSHDSGRRELPRTCGSVASPLSSGAFSVVRTRPAGKTNKVVSRQARWLPAERRNRECSSHGREMSAMDEALCRSSAAPLVFNPFHSTHLPTGIL